MTIRYRVQQWLSAGGSFRDGVSLLELAGAAAPARRHGPAMQQSFISAAQKKALRNDLVRLLSALPEDPDTAPAAPPPSQPLPQKLPDTPRIIAIRKKARGLHKERSDLKTRLLVRALDEPEKYTDEERFEIADQIMSGNVPQLDDYYDQIRRFEQDGIEPADDAQMIRDKTVGDFKEVLSIRPRISRLKKAAAKGDKEAETELATLQERLAELEATLGL